MPNPAFDKRCQALLDELRDSGQYKELKHITSPVGPTVHVEGVGEVVMLCSNNYLGLADHPEVINAGVEGLRTYGAGTASVRFICGTLDCHRTIEQSIARLMGKDAALTYVSCWNANEALIPSVAGENDVLLSDALNHASIIDACRLAGKKVAREIYAHSDMEDLAAKLEAHADKDTRWVITDGVFSMEGDVANLPRIVDLCRAHDAMLVVDDSHGTGVLGERGRGTHEFYDLIDEVDIITGTLGKALGGAAGGFVAGPNHVIDLLIQRSRPACSPMRCRPRSRAVRTRRSRCSNASRSASRNCMPTSIRCAPA